MQHATKIPSKRPLRQLVSEYPRRHLAVAGIAVMVFSCLLLLIPNENALAQRVSIPLEVPLESSVQTVASITSSAATAAPEILTQAVKPDNFEPEWQEIEVKKGDNLTLIFKRVSLSAADVYNFINKSNDSKNLVKLYPGQKFAFQIDDQKGLLAVKHIKNLLQSTVYERKGDSFEITHINKEPEVRQKYSTAVISSSLYKSAKNTGLSQELIMEMANIFSGVIDFIYDVRSGDYFSILYEENYLEGNKTGNGPILAAQFTNRGKTYTAYRYVYGDGSTGYFNEEGISMRKAFLRAPLDFNRISSGFNLKRLHPIFKTTKPHRGTDYAAARGTPVYAAGDGRVAKSGYTKSNGHYVVINHGTNYTTKYLHLNKRAVKTGQKVKQKKIIGWVGSTGYATGPHLHYEFLVNGVHRNPRTILKKLPKARSIEASEKENFIAQIKGVQLQLATYNNHHKLAKTEPNTRTSAL